MPVKLNVPPGHVLTSAETPVEAKADKAIEAVEAEPEKLDEAVDVSAANGKKGVKPNPVAQLVMEIKHLIATEPFERDGLQWAARPQTHYCKLIGVSPATLRRMISKPPFQRRQAHTGKAKVTSEGVHIEGGQKMTLLRIGEGLTQNAAKNIMAKIFADKHPSYVQADKIRWERDRQRLFKMAGEFEPKFAVDCFKSTLANWHKAAGAMKLDAESTVGYKPRFYHHPHIATMCHFWKACAYAYVSNLQEKGKIPPKEMDAALEFMNYADPLKGHPGVKGSIEEQLAAIGDAPLFTQQPKAAKKP